MLEPLSEGSRRLSAVLVLVDELDGEPKLVFVKRSDGVPSHKGDVAFPGGTHRASDGSLLATALREAAEEAGIPADAVEVLAELPALPTASSDFLIRPYLARLRRRVVLEPDGREIESVLKVPVRALLAAGTAREEEWEIRGERRRFWVYRYQGHVIWGATARILKQLLESGLMDDRGARAIPDPGR